MRLILLLALVPNLLFAQTAPPPTGNDTPRPVTSPIDLRPPPPPVTTASTLQESVDRLSKTNSELMDLLKKQQAVLEDIQYDRRLQSRQIQSLEERLQETLFENATLQNKVDKLNSTASNPGAAPTAPAVGANGANTNQPPPTPQSPPAPTPPPTPASFLPAAPVEAASSGAASWHRLFTLSGNDNRSTDLFQIQGHHWRVLWHNQDPDGKAYKNTSALFLNAFPKDDTIPQKVCAKLGSGGDITELVGPGNYYLKIEASGGSWEVAVEDFH